MAAGRNGNDDAHAKHGWWRGVLRGASSRRLSEEFACRADEHNDDEDEFYECEEGDWENDQDKLEEEIVAEDQRTRGSWVQAGLAAIAGIPAFLVHRRAADQDRIVDQECSQEDDGWLVFPGCRVAPAQHGADCCQDDEVDAMPCTNLGDCKRVCEARGYGGFVLEQDVAFFHTRSRSQLAMARRCVIPASTANADSGAPMLYLAPDSEMCSDEANLRQEWLQVMEANVALVRELIGERLRAQAEAEVCGDVAGVEASARDLRKLEERQACLECILWHVGDEGAIGKDDVHAKPSAASPETDMQKEKKCSAPAQPPPRIEGKGKAKGGKGLPAPPARGKGRASEEKMPLGRRFHWQALQPEQLRGTVFDGASPLHKTPTHLKELTALFRVKAGEFNGQAGPQNPAPGKKAQGSSSSTVQGGVLTQRRVQHIGIVLCRVLGLAAKPEDAERLARGVEAMELPLPGMPTGQLEEAERLNLLASAIPTPDESAALWQADARALRPVERLLLPLSKVPRAAARLRALRLAVQARDHQRALDARIQALRSSSQALRTSDALRKLLLAVAQLGSWINSADPSAHRGFALSSALGKLREFRALQGSREVTLLHVAVLTAAEGDASAAGALGEQLVTELRCLSETSREQLGDLEQEVRDFGADASWVAAEARWTDVDGTGSSYTDEARARLQAIYEEELLGRADALAASWSSTREELENTLVFFAERWDRDKGFGAAVSRLFSTVESFTTELRRAARQVSERPQRYLPANSTAG